MKLDVNALRYLTKDDFRVLTAVEMGMRNHEIVPAELVDRIAGLKHGGTYKVLRNLLKNKLVHHDATKYDGYRLTYLGYDFLAIKTLGHKKLILKSLWYPDIFEVATEDGTVLAMKLHRLGRTSFRAVKSKRDYLRHRRSFNWLYLSRLAALKEFAFMKALGDHGFPVPTAVDCNRHCVIMSLVQGYPLSNVMQIDDDEKITVIDFPQMVSVSHCNAQMFFDRDIECIYKFFNKRFNLTSEKNEEQAGSESDGEGNSRPSFLSVKKSAGSLDRELAASGFTRKEQVEMEKYIEEDAEGHDSSSDDDDEIGDAVPIDSLKIDQDHCDEPDCNLASRDSGGAGTFSEEHGTSCSGEDRLESPPSGSNGDAKEPLESEGKMLSQEDGDNDSSSNDDNDDEEDAELTKKLNMQGKRQLQLPMGGEDLCPPGMPTRTRGRAP
ncbi:serine/threonine-protein kinase rio2 [Panicum miliaceum]|uniref:Serine/threonine-protein kinase RIO2 n=1 Tax=Panicum miliaceum TaxID=4540 RepID=A0A3L6RH78_PANMI|nr:serine/threonine-protein kinase rio2 [Panicum miliaceum]